MVYVTTFEQKSIAITTTNRSLQKQLTSDFFFFPPFKSLWFFSFDKSVKDRNTAFFRFCWKIGSYWIWLTLHFIAFWAYTWVKCLLCWVDLMKNGHFWWNCLHIVINHELLPTLHHQFTSDLHYCSECEVKSYCLQAKKQSQNTFLC